MKQFLLALITLISINQALAQHDGNGGGGPKKNGVPMTFYSAGFYIEPAELPIEKIPMLEETINYFANSQYLSVETKMIYTTNLTPTFDRKYYNLKEEDLNGPLRERLLAEYARVMKINPDEVAIYALTDTNSKTTYLLPEFYELKSPEQKMAILFHEAYWIKNPIAQYKEVIEAEMSYQAHLENLNSPSYLFGFIQKAGEEGDLFNAAIQYDIENESLKKLLVKNRSQRGDQNHYMLLSTFLGTQFLQCAVKTPAEKCIQYFKLNLHNLSSNYPNSYFLKFAKEFALSESIAIESNPYEWEGIIFLNKSLFSDSYNSEFLNKFSKAVINLNSSESHSSLQLRILNFVNKSSFRIIMSKNITNFSTRPKSQD